MPDITAPELKQRIVDGTTPVVLDVRELYEWEAGNLAALAPAHVQHVPLGSLPQLLANGDLDDYKDQEIVAVCRAGSRSASAVQFLRQSRFAKVRNLTGGMQAWKAQVDPTVQVA